MNALLEKEVKSYFNNMMGYAFIAFILLFAGIYTMAINLNNGYANFEYTLGNMSFIFLIAIPIFTMRAIAEEKKQKTDQLLYTLPFSMTKIVMAKYLAMLFVLIIPTLIISLYPVMLSGFGAVNFKAVYGTIAAFFMLGACLISIGLFISSMTENQVLAAALSFITVLLNYFITDLAYYVSSTATASFFAFTVIILLLGIIIRLLTKSGWLALLFSGLCEGIILILLLVRPDTFQGLFPSVMKQFSLFERFYSFVYGVFDWTAVAGFLTITGVFLFLTVQSLEKKRWN